MTDWDFNKYNVLLRLERWGDAHETHHWSYVKCPWVSLFTGHSRLKSFSGTQRTHMCPRRIIRQTYSLTITLFSQMRCLRINCGLQRGLFRSLPEILALPEGPPLGLGTQTYCRPNSDFLGASRSDKHIHNACLKMMWWLFYQEKRPYIDDQ